MDKDSFEQMLPDKVANSFRSQQDSPLFRLPAELRIMIYEYALDTTTFHPTYILNAHGEALLKTCKQAIRETFP